MDKTNKVTCPVSGFKDELDRVYNEQSGFSQGIDIPLGSHVTLLPVETAPLSCRNIDWEVGMQGIVIDRVTPACGRVNSTRIHVRKLADLGDWDSFRNDGWWEAAFARVDKVGDGDVPLPGVHYLLSKREYFDKLWSQTNHTCGGLSNPATYQAFVLLRNNTEHVAAVRAMVRKNGTVNPDKIRAYWQSMNLSLDETVLYRRDFPKLAQYQYHVDWDGVASWFRRGAITA